MAAGGDIAAAHEACNDDVDARAGAGIAALRPAPAARRRRSRPRRCPDSLTAGALDEPAAGQERIKDRLGQALEERQVVQHLQERKQTQSEEPAKERRPWLIGQAPGIYIEKEALLCQQETTVDNCCVWNQVLLLANSRGRLLAQGSTSQRRNQGQQQFRKSRAMGACANANGAQDFENSDL